LENAKNIGNLGKKVVGVMKSGETRTLAEFIENGWSVLENLWFTHLPHKCKNDGHLFELTGAKTVCISILKYIVLPRALLDLES